MYGLAVNFCTGISTAVDRESWFGFYPSPITNHQSLIVVALVARTAAAPRPGSLRTPGALCRLKECELSQPRAPANEPVSAFAARARSAWARLIRKVYEADPLTRRIVVAKSTNHFMAAFGPIAKKVIYVESDGPPPRDYRKLAYAKVLRPIWPRDAETTPGQGARHQGCADDSGAGDQGDRVNLALALRAKGQTLKR